MELTVDGRKVYAATGGRTFDPANPLVIFIHGAGQDHTNWQLPARWFAWNGYTALALDLPGHGRSDGPPLETADAKSALQEWAQGQGLELPQYVEVERKGPDHAPSFTAEVRIKGLRAARGEGASKRTAEQAAAAAMLAREGVRSDRPDG